jgi:hypothetical protein
LSSRYSRSPALRLRIGRSQLRALLHGGLCVLVLYALWEIYCLGYALLSLLLVLPALALLYRLRLDPTPGAELCFCRGAWTLESNGVQRMITPGRRCIVTPWVIYLAFTEAPSGAAQQLWLYVDSVHPQQWRRLRVRLTLLR